MYSYLGKAEPDEPVFLLMARDPQAPALVREWAERRRQRGESPDRVAEAFALATEMDKWAALHCTKSPNGKHNAVLSRGANPARGYRPAACEFCDKDMSEDSSD